MTTKLEYKLANGVRVGDLAADVEASGKQGWRPIGGVCYVESMPFGGMFFQAMVKESETPQRKDT